MIAYYLIMALTYSPVGIYYYFFFKRFYSLFNKKITNNIKILFALIAVIITLLGCYPFGVYIVIFTHFFVFSLIVDFFMYLERKLNKNNKKLEVLQKSGILPTIFTIILLIFAYLNMTNVVVKEYEIKTNKNISSDYKIVFLSDLHYPTTMNSKKLEKYAQEISNLGADAVILGGDMTDENTRLSEMKTLYGILGNIKSKYGIFFVYGNHDKAKYNGGNKNYTTEELKSTIEEVNIKILTDENYSINNDIILIGRDDTDFPLLGKRKTSEELIENLDKDKFLLLVDHHPNDLYINSTLGYDLQLSGHTHGGQIFPTGLIEELFDNKKLIYGYRKIDNFEAIVTSGMGGWAYPFRTGNNSEYLLVTIKKS